MICRDSGKIGVDVLVGGDGMCLGTVSPWRLSMFDKIIQPFIAKSGTWN